MSPVYINGRFLTQRITGTQRYAHELVAGLDAVLAGSSAPRPAVKLLMPPGSQPPQYRCIEAAQVGRGGGHWWEQFELPFYARGGILLSLVGSAPLWHRRNVVTMHDAAVFAAPTSFSAAFRLWYQFLHRALCRTALHIFTVSNFSREELIRWCGAKPEKITVTYAGAEHILRTAPEASVLSRHKLCRGKYVLAVGSRNPSKNFDALLRAMDIGEGLEFGLAIAGASYSKVFGAQHLDGKRIIDLGYVSDSELRSLYEDAACFVFPSRYEGFGLPPLEALALGTPVVVADTSALGEIFRDVAFLCDPDDPADIAAKIGLACRASGEDKARYREFADGFRWKRCAKIAWSALLGFCD